MRFDVYGRFRIEIVREGGAWVAYRVGQGLRRAEEILIPGDLAATELAAFLDGVYHELAAPGRSVRRLD